MGGRVAKRDKGSRTLQNRPLTYQKNATHTWQVTKVGELIDIPNETGKIGLRKFLHERKMPEVKDARCGCRRGEETVRHVLTECRRFKEMKRTMWARDVRKARLNWIDLRTILTTPAYVKKAALFMQKTDLLGQFRGLKWSQPT